MSLSEVDALAEANAIRRNTGPNQVMRHGFQTPERPALRWKGGTITWGELAGSVRRVSDGFERRGVGFGDRVAILLNNRPEFLIAMYAANRLGAIVVPINFRLTPDEISYVLRDSGSAILVVEASLLDAALSSAAMLESELRIVLIGDEPAVGTESWSVLIGEEPGTAVIPDVPDDSPALIMYTSGTTGKPKGATLSHANVLGQALTSIRFYRIFTDDEVYLLGTPLFHVGGIGSISSTVLVGGTIVFSPSGTFDPSATLDLIEAEHVTSTFLVPAQLQLMAEDSRILERDFSLLRNICWGGAPATDVLLRRLDIVFPSTHVIAGFGQTEMSPITCVMSPEDSIRKLGSVGKPIPTIWWRVVDEEMQDVPQGEIGEIIYRGPTQMLGYWNNPEATAEAFAGGWFHSGDLVEVDDEGFVYVVDRKKDMIISGGENIYSTEVENVLADHPAIIEVSLVGRPSEQWGESPVAVVVLRQPLEIEELRTWASARLARYKLPVDLLVVDALPRNPSGKVLKRDLRAVVDESATK
jgi:fatty-acyl-CoA synthase